MIPKKLSKYSVNKEIEQNKNHFICLIINLFSVFKSKITFDQQTLFWNFFRLNSIMVRKAPK